jgi:hypothetical protein
MVIPKYARHDKILHVFELVIMCVRDRVDLCTFIIEPFDRFV